MSTTERPASDQVVDDFADFISDEINNNLGRSGLRGYQWAGDDDDDDPYPPLIVSDKAGRTFEIEFDVSVTELTEEELARRAALLAQFKAQQAKATSGGA